ncbi:hypothetical protein T484DRAFT_1770212 [Baffinella frigidus]|nr:hypothetical protein T484DRAFT_1770212 [Cryptophyta sp. CCMP2293]
MKFPLLTWRGDALAEIRYYAKSVLLQPTTVDRAAIEESVNPSAAKSVLLQPATVDRAAIEECGKGVLLQPATVDRVAIEEVKSVVEKGGIGVKSLVEKGTQISVQDPAPGAPLMEDDIAYLDAAGIETVLGESLSSGALPLAKALSAVIVSDRPDGLIPTIVAVSAVIVSDRPDGLIPTIVVDEDNAALGLCYSNHESLAEALKQQSVNPIVVDEDDAELGLCYSQPQVLLQGEN